jgi:hypothetical protein
MIFNNNIEQCFILHVYAINEVLITEDRGEDQKCVMLERFVPELWLQKSFTSRTCTSIYRTLLASTQNR